MDNFKTDILNLGLEPEDALKRKIWRTDQRPDKKTPRQYRIITRKKKKIVMLCITY